jgi:predicted N-acetyltransferase YhbS
MPELKIYRFNEALPAEYECQIRSFIRLTWYDGYVHNLDEPLVPPERHPQHVVVADRHAVISHARVNWVDVEHQGQHLKVYCLGDVFTYPAFRKKGHGRSIVDAGTALIREDKTADAAILFTDPELEPFYGASGWEPIDLTPSMGQVESPEPYEAHTMMLFLSERAKRHVFENQPIFLPGYGW